MLVLPVAPSLSHLFFFFFQFVDPISTLVAAGSKATIYRDSALHHQINVTNDVL
jgi:hypothetical protein